MRNNKIFSRSSMFALICILFLSSLAFAETKHKSDDADDSETTTENADAPPKKHKKHHSRDDSYKIRYEDLTQEEKEILARGPVNDTSYAVGGVVGTFVGFGIGHAVQGRYGEKGWIFTVGELGSIALIVAGLAQSITNCSYGSNCANSAGTSEILIGYFGVLGFRIWEIIDLWATPPSINNRWRDLHYRVDEEREARLTLSIVSLRKDVTGLGLQLRF
jgi:hypothetical protein